MRRRWTLALILALLAVLALPLAASAGGWAVVTLDALPQGPRAGQTLTLGFVVRQHGVTPISAPYGAGSTMQPRLTARNQSTGETLQAIARQEGAVGHFTVDVTFPSAGAWDWEIAPEPFAATKLGTLTVLPAGANSTQPATGVTSGAPQPTATRILSLAPVALRWVGLALLVAAALLALTSWRGAPTRWRVRWAR